MTRVPDWPSPPRQPTLHGRDIHVWRAWLDLPAWLVRDMERLLSPDESERARRFRFERDRRRFAVARGFLREVLGFSTGAHPRELEFRYGPRGKPRLAGEGDLAFNLSHSEDIAICAVGRGCSLGVDVERIRPFADAQRLAEQFFSPTELAVFRTVPARDRLLSFFNCWTRKEAWVKATGDGLSRSLDDFDVTLAPGTPARLLRVREAPEEAERWTLRDLAPASGYVGAVAIESSEGGLEWSVRCRRWEPHVSLFAQARLD